MTKDRRLGRGLAALLGGSLDELAGDPVPRQETPTSPGAFTGHSPTGFHVPPRDSISAPVEAPVAAEPRSGDLLHLSVQDIDENPFQPRRDFDESELASLAESLKEHDMLQPVLVRRNGGRYQLISGERRLRAAIKAGWATVPARLREADDRLVAELAIVENLQRQDLNPIEKALSFKRYLDEHRCTQEELAGRLKLDRSTIANLVRLLELPPGVLDALRNGVISAGHARALLPLGNEKQQLEFCERIGREELSVRSIERLVGEQLSAEDSDVPAIAGRVGGGRRKPKNDQLSSLEQQLRLAVGAKVEIQQSGKGRGKIVLHFTDHDEFERLFELMTNQGGARPLAELG